MDSFVQDVLLPALLTLAGALVTYLTYHATRWLERATQNQRSSLIDQALQLASRTALATVTDLMHTTIAELKAAREDGRLTGEEARAALNAATANVWTAIGKTARNALTNAAGSEAEAIATYIKPIVEQQVAHAKQTVPTPAPIVDPATREKEIALARSRLGLQR